MAEYFDSTETGMREVLMRIHDQADAPSLDQICMWGLEVNV